MRAFWLVVLTFAGAGMFLGAYMPWLDLEWFGGSGIGFFSAADFASSSTGEWHSRFGSSSLFTEVARAVGLSAIVCGVGVLVAAVLWVLVPERSRIWVRWSSPAFVDT